MLKHSKALSFLADQIGEAVSVVANEFGEVAAIRAHQVLDHVGRDDLSGREETITPGLAGEYTSQLFDAVKLRLNNQEVYGVSFKVHCFKHSEEKVVGADLAGILTIRAGRQSLTKIYLAQAKVASTAKMLSSRSAMIRAGDRNLLRQCGEMLHRSPASYVFVYSRFGVHVVPATAVSLKGKGQVDTSIDYYRSLKMFYTEFFKCFVGDTTLGAKMAATKNVKDVFHQLRVANGMSITAELQQHDLFEG